MEIIPSIEMGCIYAAVSDSKRTQRNATQRKNDRLRGRKSSVFSVCSAFTFLIMCIVSCSGEHIEPFSGRAAKLTAGASAVLSFESAADWQGIDITNDAHTHGAMSGEVNVNGWTQVSSVPLSSIAAETLGNQAFIDVRLPQSVYWGEVRLIVEIPSQGIWWREVGSAPLSPLPAEAFGTVSFELPSDVQAALNGTYTDLKFIVVVNGPSMSSPVLLDNLRISGNISDTESASDSDDVDPDELSFAFTLPASVDLESVVVQTGESVRIADAVNANGAANATVVNMGQGLAEFGADATIDGDVYAFGATSLRERSRIEGILRSDGPVEQQNNVTVVGGIVSPANLVVGSEYKWSVSRPEATTSHNIEPDTELTLAPGSYGSLNVKSRARLNLSGGIYYFDSFISEPQSQIHVNGEGEPVFIYVQSTLTSRAQLVHSTTSADFFIAFAGEGVVDLDGPFAGTVVAPNATIRLAPLNGGSHEGSFFAKRVEAEARTPIDFVSFDHWEDIPSDPEYPLPVVPPVTLPLPPSEIGCYVGTLDGWVVIPCEEGVGDDFDKIIPEYTEQAIKSKPVDPMDANSVVPIRFGQLEAKFVTFGGVTDVLNGVRHNDIFSFQLNTNRFLSAGTSDIINQGETAVAQFAIQLRNIGGKLVNEISMWQINRSQVCHGSLIDEPCALPQDYNGYNSFFPPLSFETRPEQIHDNDYASIGVSTYDNADGTPVIGMVTKFSWIDKDGDWIENIKTVDSDKIKDLDGFNGTFAMVRQDLISLKEGWTDVSGDFLGMGNGSRAEFFDTSVITRLMAGSCVNSIGPDPEIPWPGECSETPNPLIDSTIVDVTAITAESNNLTPVWGPTALTALTDDLVYTQYLSSTSGTCQSGANRVYVKDVASDFGVEPSDYSNEPFWESPDIFVVPQGMPVSVEDVASEAHLSPGSTYDFYVRVHNDFGCKPVTGIKTHIYIADPSALSVTWQSVTGDDFVGNITVSPGESGLIGPISWTAPTDGLGDGHKCILASIKSDTQVAPADDFDAPASNQVAQRNVQFSDCSFPITNSMTQPGNIIVKLTALGAMPSLASGGNNISMTFDDPDKTLYNTWSSTWQGYGLNGHDYLVTQKSGKTTVRLGQRAVLLEAVPINAVTTIGTEGAILINSGEPTTTLEMLTVLFDSTGEHLKNGVSCVADGGIYID